MNYISKEKFENKHLKDIIKYYKMRYYKLEIIVIKQENIEVLRIACIT